MKFRVCLTDRAHAEMEAAYGWWARNRSSTEAVRWYTEFARAIESLADDPERHPLSRESNRFPAPIRDLVFGVGKRLTHRAVFLIRADLVLVVAVRHLAQSSITPDDL